MDAQDSLSFFRTHSTMPSSDIVGSSRRVPQSAGTPRDVRDLWGEEVFEVLVGIVMSLHARKGEVK